MPRKQAKRAVPPKAHRANTSQAEQRDRHAGEDEAIAARRVTAFGLRKTGASYRQIAQKLSVSLNTAWADVNAELLELREQTKADVAEVRDIELQRCDEMIRGLWPAVETGDPKAVLAAVRVMDRRARLMGLDAPTKSELSGPGGNPIEVQEIRESLTRKLTSLAARLGAGAVAGEPDRR